MPTRFLFDKDKLVDNKFQLVFNCGRFISVIKNEDNTLDLFTSDRNNLTDYDEGPDIKNCSIEQINKNIVEFIVTHGLPKEFNRQEIKFFPLSKDE